MDVRRLVIALVFLAACGTDSRPVRIGVAGPLTESYGVSNRRGIELAVEEINAAGGVDGRPLEIAARDDEGDGAKAAAIAAGFVADPEIVAVVGHMTSGAMVSAARMYDGRLAAVATTASSPELSGISPWVFRVIPSDSVNGATLGRFAAALGRRRAAVLYENDSYGRGLADAFRRSFPGAIVGFDPIAADERDFEPFVAHLLTRAPDVVFVAGTEGTGLGFLREARRQGLEAAFLGGDGWLGIVTDRAASEGAYVGAPFSPADPRPAVKRFVEAYRKRYGDEPDGNAALAYDATHVVARAIAEGGRERERVRDRLAALGEGRGMAGVTGQIRFDGRGDLLGRGMLVTRVERGVLVPAGVR